MPEDPQEVYDIAVDRKKEIEAELVIATVKCREAASKLRIHNMQRAATITEARKK